MELRHLSKFVGLGFLGVLVGIYLGQKITEYLYEEVILAPYKLFQAVIVPL